MRKSAIQIGGAFAATAPGARGATGSARRGEAIAGPGCGRTGCTGVVLPAGGNAGGRGRGRRAAVL
jgi:hypothetical protein